jgi:CBS domain containing-hemolysin-like protein
MSHPLFFILLAVLLVLLNGFFVAAEFGLVKLRQTRVRAIARTHGWRGRILARVHGELDAYLSACQLGITLASLGLGWVGEPAFADLLRPLLEALGVASEQLIHAIAFAAAFFIISYLHIVVGELAPKSMAIRRSEVVGLWTAPPLYAFYWAMYPAIWVLNHSANWVLRKVHLEDAGHSHDIHYSADELKIILRSSRANQDFTPDEWRVLAQALDFRDLEVADLMRPFHEAAVLDSTESMATHLEVIAQNRYSRYPYLDAEGKILGVIHLKDVFIALQKDAALDTLETLVRPVQIVSPRLAATELFRRLRKGAPHFAVVAHDEAHPLGFITLDNLLGALVGEIRDEFRQSQNDWFKLDDGSLMGKGSLPLFTLERALGLDIDAGEVDSIGGLIMQKLGDIPAEGQRVEFPGFAAVVKKMSGPRILLVRVLPEKQDAAHTK